MNVPAAPLKIGQVHALLRRECPNLELSKIRYYEEMGLVAPSRSRKGYRLYSEKDVSCLREAIRLADEEFVPLRVIRIRLIEHGLLKDDVRPSLAARQVARSADAKVVSIAVPSEGVSSLQNPGGPSLVAVNDEQSTESRETLMSTNQLLEACHVEPDVFNRILSLGLISPASSEAGTMFDSLDVVIVRAAAVLLRSGADPRLLGALRRVVERQIGILDELTADLRAGSSTPSEIVAVRRSVARDVEDLRSSLFERALADFLDL